MPKPFESFLLSKGLPDTRITMLYNTFDLLHEAISKFDN